MRTRILYTFASLLAIAAFCCGCTSLNGEKKSAAEPQPAMRALGQPVAPPSQPAVTPPTKPDDEVVSNEDIGLEIRRRLGADPTSTAGIIVEVDDGKVTLHGTAPNLAAAWRAQATALAVKGVKSVVNQIIVNTPNVPP